MADTKPEPLKLRLEREDKEDGSITYHLWTDEGDWIVGLNDDATKQGGNAHAYANTIVRCVNTAPDLLAALKTAKEAIRVWHGPNQWDIYDRASPEMKAINSAIAKAEGRS